MPTTEDLERMSLKSSSKVFPSMLIFIVEESNPPN